MSKFEILQRDWKESHIILLEQMFSEHIVILLATKTFLYDRLVVVFSYVVVAQVIKEDTNASYWDKVVYIRQFSTTRLSYLVCDERKLYGFTPLYFYLLSKTGHMYV